MKLVFSKTKNEDRIKINVGFSLENCVGYIQLEIIESLLIYRLREYKLPESLFFYKGKIEHTIKSYLAELNNENLKSNYLFHRLVLHKELFLN